MVKLRLTRTGKKNHPTYRIVAIQARTKRDGQALETLGFYNPRTSPSTLELNKERISYWLQVGAQPTQTVRFLLAKEKLVAAPKLKFADKPGRKAEERAKAAAAKEQK